MIRLAVKLAIVALIANAGWHAALAYLTFYRFRDAVGEAAQFSRGKSDDELRLRILDLASNYDVPLADDDLTVRRQDTRVVVSVSYRLPVDLGPGWRYPWPFSFTLDSLTMISIPRSGGIAPP
jgi:hypothetical protein